MIKKLTFCVLLLFICTQLTACGPFDKIIKQAKDVMEGIQTTELKDKVAEDNLFAMSNTTQKAQNAALKSADKAAKLADKSANMTLIGRILPWNWFIETRAQSAAVKANSALNKYETAKSQDATWLKARESAGKEGVNGVFQWSKFGWIIGFILCLLLIGFIVMLLNFRKKAKAQLRAAKKADTVIIQQPSAPIAPVTAQATMVARDDAKSIQQCQKYCDKFGLDYDTALQQYGNGDPKQLLNVLVTSSKEDFQ